MQGAPHRRARGAAVRVPATEASRGRVVQVPEAGVCPNAPHLSPPFATLDR